MRPATSSSSIAACARSAYSATEPSCDSGQIPTSRVGRSGCAVRIGSPRYACIESAETTSPPTRSATAVLPDAVGPKIATMLGDGKLEVGFLRHPVADEVCGVLRVLAEPGDRARDSLVERHARLPAEQVARLADVRDVVRHLAEQGRREADLRLDAERAGDQLRGPDERVALAEREVDRLVDDVAGDERLDPTREAVDAVVDVREVECLVAPAVDRDRLVVDQAMREQRDHAHHPRQVVVVAAVHVREAEDEIAQPVAARIRVDQRLGRDLRRRVWALRERKVRGRLAVLLEAVDVAVDLAGRREDQRQVVRAAVLEDVERHDRVLERAPWLPHQLVHLCVGGEVDDHVRRRIVVAEAAREGQVLEQVAEVVRPRVQALVDAEDLVAVLVQAQGEVRPDLPARAGDENAHQAATGTAWTPRRVVEVASSIRTSTSSPGAAVPAKLTVVLRRVRPRSSVGSLRLGPSTRTSSTPPTRSALRSAATRWTTSTSRSIRSRLTSSGIWSSITAASVPARGEYTNVNAPSKPTSSTTSSVSRKSVSVSPGKPTMRSVVSARSGIAARSSSARRR